MPGEQLSQQKGQPIMRKFIIIAVAASALAVPALRRSAGTAPDGRWNARSAKAVGNASVNRRVLPRTITQNSQHDSGTCWCVR